MCRADVLYVLATTSALCFAFLWIFVHNTYCLYVHYITLHTDHVRMVLLSYLEIEEEQ